MPKKTAIVTDSTCDLDPALAAARQIHIVPLYVIWSGHSYKDRHDLTADAFYERLATASDMPSTSQPNVTDFVEGFRAARAATGADEIVCVTIAAGLSATYNAATQAAQMLDFPVTVVPGGSTSLTLGFAALTAADARDAGQVPMDIVDTTRRALANARMFFTVATLEYLHRGGRIGQARRFVGDLLRIRPILESVDGEVQVAATVRTRKRVLETLVNLVGEALGDKRLKRMAVVHSHAEDRQELVDMLAATYHFSDIPTTVISPVLGVHIGPGAIGVAIETEN